MGNLIWLIIIVSIVAQIVKKQKDSDKHKTARQDTNRQSQQRYQQPPQSGYQKQSQQELKQRLQKRYGNRQQGSRQLMQQGHKMPQQNDILSRATANVMENEKDRLEQQMEETDRDAQRRAEVHSLTNAIDIEGTSALMQDVEDLIVMGYQANLTFERDFVAEGIEMLHQYKVPDTVPDTSLT